MSVHDLTREQLEELKTCYFWGADTMGLVPENVWSHEQIPDDIIFDYYGGISFVNEDFFCSYVASVPCVLPF